MLIELTAWLLMSYEEDPTRKFNIIIVLALETKISYDILELIFKWSCNLEMKNDKDRVAFEVNFKNALRGISLSFQSPTTKYNPWSSLKQKCVEGARLTRETAKSVVEMRQRDLNAGNEISEDALSYVFKLKKTLPDWDIEDLVDMLVTIVFGGNQLMILHGC